MTPQEILIAARAKIADEANWCQENSAVNSHRIPVHPTNSNACAWCALGALEATSPATANLRSLLYEAAYATHGLRSVVDVNDTLGHAAVLQVYDVAIKIAGETP